MSVTNITDMVNKKLEHDDLAFFYLLSDIQAGRPIREQDCNRVVISVISSFDFADKPPDKPLNIYNDVKAGVIKIIDKPGNLVGGMFSYVKFTQANTIIICVLNLPTDPTIVAAYKKLVLKIKEKYRNELYQLSFSLKYLTIQEVRSFEE